MAGGWFRGQYSSVAQSCPTLCDPMNCSTPGLPVHHQLPEFTQTHIHQISDTIQPSHPLSSPSPPAPNPSQHQSLFPWVNSSRDSTQYCKAITLQLKSKMQNIQKMQMPVGTLRKPLRVPGKYWSFSFSIIPSKEHPGLISFRMDWMDLLAVQGTLKSLLGVPIGICSFLIFCILLNWRVIVLQYCVDFCHTSTRIRNRSPPFWTSLPILSQSSRLF